jgi:hypothetical protein
MNGILNGRFHQVCCGEDSPAGKFCKVGNVSNGIFVGDCPGVQSTIVATGSPAVLFLGGRGGGVKPRGYRNVERYRCGATPRTQISRFGGGLVLDVVGANL